MNNDIPLVSIIISTNCRKDLLKGTIESLFVQSYPKSRYEIIVVDNASTDGTEDLVMSLKSASPCCLKYYKKEDEGPGTSRNIGIKMACGNIVAFTDDDCIADPYWLQNGVARMVGGVGLVQGKTLPDPRQTVRTFSRTQKVLGEDGLYLACNIFYRRDVLDSVAGFSPEFCGLNKFGRPRIGGEDTDLAWKVKKAGWKSVFADDAVVFHHIFYQNPWQTIVNFKKIQVFFYAWPNLAKKHPEMRKKLFYLHVFREKASAIPGLFLLSLLLGILLNRVFFLLGLPYITSRATWVFSGRPLAAYHRGFIALIIYALSDLVMLILLLSGSIWYHTLVL